ncbi:MAG: DUF4230 domain-containing protein, partial [Chloroflexota bacterium]
MDEKKVDSNETPAKDVPLGPPVRAEQQKAPPVASQEASTVAAAPSRGNWLRNLAFLSIIIFFCLLSGVVAMFAIGANQAKNEVIEPVSNLVRQLVLPVTPEIIPNPTTIIREIQDLQRLETASFEFEKVITAETKQDLLWGLLGESVVFVANGKVYAGVDFAKMAESDLQVYDPVTVYVHLPKAEIFEDIPVLDTQQSYVADRDTGLLTRADPELETQVRQEAEKAIREAADESEILARADNNARQYMIAFLS